MRSRRIHATADINGRTVHVDWVNNSDWGCSLGAVGRDLPLVARIGANTAMTLDYLWRGLPIVEVWEVDVCGTGRTDEGRRRILSRAVRSTSE